MTSKEAPNLIMKMKSVPKTKVNISFSLLGFTLSHMHVSQPMKHRLTRSSYSSYAKALLKCVMYSVPKYPSQTGRSRILYGTTTTMLTRR